TRRREVYEGVLREQPHLAQYVGRVLSERGEASIAFFERSLQIARSEMEAMIEAGLARPFEDPDVGIALYWLLVNARFLLRPYLEAAMGLDLSNPADLDRLHRAEIDLLTRPVFPLPPPTPSTKGDT